MDQPTLFELPPEREQKSETPLAGKPRLRMAQRDQVIVRTLALDQMLPHDDEARTVWDFVCQCDLSPLLQRIRAVEGNAGHPPADPRILLALWRMERVQQALVACAEVQAQKDSRRGDPPKNPARASTTDPDARNMKMADGGFRPAYNVQFATDTASQVIVGVEVTNQGSDAGQVAPMVEQVQQRTGVRPKDVLIDGGFCSHAEIEALNDPEQGYKVYTPVKAGEKKLERGEDPFAPRRRESDQLTEWRVRMGTPEAQEIYKQRAASAECVNALARQRGLTQFRVRGTPKVRTVAVWFALAHNLRRWAVLRADLTTTVHYS
jgi:hypothetical protein